MQRRKDPLQNNHYYHIYSRSIAGYKIFNDATDFERFYNLLNLCRFCNFDYKYSTFMRLSLEFQLDVMISLKKENNALVEIIAYCLMPTHIHLLVKQLKEEGISKFMARVLNAYSKYFNTRHGRLGPLWSGRFKNVLIQNDEYLLHLTRYIHLNPTSAGLVNSPTEWQYSSYNYFIDPVNSRPDFITPQDDLFSITPKQYKKFVLDQKSYQRELAQIKSLTIDNYTG